MSNKITGIIKRRDIGRIMDVYRGDLSQITSWVNKQSPLLDNIYNIEIIHSGKYPIGFPGKDDKFDNDLFITVPPVPEGFKPFKEEYKGIKSKKMSPMPVVDCLIRFGPEICIVGGELHWRVYSTEFLNELIAQLEFTKSLFPNNKLPYKVKIICGPIALTKTRRKGQRLKGTILPQLIEHEDIEVYYSKYRQKEHFRLNPMAVYYEDRHAPNTPERRGFATFYDKKELIEFQKKKIRILKDENVIRCNNYNDMNNWFEFLTEEEMDRLVKVIEKEYSDREKPEEAFDELDKNDLRSFYKAAKISIN